MNDDWKKVPQSMVKDWQDTKPDSNDLKAQRIKALIQRASDLERENADLRRQLAEVLDAAANKAMEYGASREVYAAIRQLKGKQS